MTSAAPVIALLDQEEDDLKIVALEKLNQIVDEFWAEIAGTPGAVEKIEVFCEDEGFK